ncbi:MAG: PDZ domain-containing protein [Bacteroidales bacterium]|nr:PDZ domain-containing protein [Bacteroidales bacterium]
MKKSIFSNFKLFFFSLIAIFILSCEKDNTGKNAEDLKNIEISRWIYYWMRDAYLWNNTFSWDINVEEKTKPFDFFDELVYETEDKWSYITDEYSVLKDHFSGTPVSMGYSPAFGLLGNEGNVFIIVEYVYPNSPADNAGLKRGDIIIKINGTMMNTENYYDLFSQTSYSVELGSFYQNAIYPAGRTISLTATQIEADPLVYNTIFNIGEKKIGYMVYTDFISGDEEQYLTELDQLFDNFKTSQVTELIVDLRYNPGGEFKAAARLASAIAPSSVLSGSNIFVTIQYNDSLQHYLETTEGPDSENLKYNYQENSHNLNLSNVYFLTTGNSASASEMLIVGLEPYMNVTVIGEATFGKYCGSWLIYDFDIPPAHDWAMMPIVMKYANAQGYTDFKDGIAPDYLVEDNLIEAKPFGDLSDPMLATAIEKITGMTFKSAKTVKTSDLKRLDSKMDRMKRNLIMPAPSK